MSLTISLPDEFAEVLGASPTERDQQAREALALDLYRQGKISLRRMGELAGRDGDYWAADQLRVAHGLGINYTAADLEKDYQTFRLMRP